MTNLAHKFGEREAKSGGTGVKLILKYRFFFSILSPIFGIRAIWSSEKCKVGCSNVSGTNWGTSPLSSGKCSHFLILALLFYPSLQKIGLSLTVKNYFLE